MYTHKQEIERQRLGRNKDTAINQNYIESGMYRKKFNALSDNPELNRLLYRLAKKMLLHRAGTNYEDMYWIDLDTLKIVAKEINSPKKEKIIYSKKTRKIIQEYKKDISKHLLTIHSHPNSFPPSIDDINSNFKNNYDVGIIICHNGTIYSYAANEKINITYYKIVIADYKKIGYNEHEAQIKALCNTCKYFDIVFKEVTGNDAGK